MCMCCLIRIDLFHIQLFNDRYWIYETYMYVCLSVCTYVSSCWICRHGPVRTAPRISPLTLNWQFSVQTQVPLLTHTLAIKEWSGGGGKKTTFRPTRLQEVASSLTRKVTSVLRTIPPQEEYLCFETFPQCSAVRESNSGSDEKCCSIIWRLLYIVSKKLMWKLYQMTYIIPF